MLSIAFCFLLTVMHGMKLLTVFHVWAFSAFQLIWLPIYGPYQDVYFTNYFIFVEGTQLLGRYRNICKNFLFKISHDITDLCRSVTLLFSLLFCCRINLLRTNLSKWSNTLKPFVGFCRWIAWVCLTILWVWRLKGYVFKRCQSLVHLTLTCLVSTKWSNTLWKSCNICCRMFNVCLTVLWMLSAIYSVSIELLWNC